MNYNKINYLWRVKVERILDVILGPLMFQYKRRDNMFYWFYNSLVYQHITWPQLCPKYNYYEFGVASGGSMEIYVLALKEFCRKYKQDISKFHIYAFDSFEGLPPEEGEADKSVLWGEGQMVNHENLVLAKIARHDFPSENFHMIKGFFDKTLTAELRSFISSNIPAIVNIDCDYYSSTRLVLEWLEPMLASGTIFRFDDIWAYHGNPNYGEIKAIKELNAKGIGHLAEFPLNGLISYAYIYSRNNFEHKEV